MNPITVLALEQRISRLENRNKALACLLVFILGWVVAMFWWSLSTASVVHANSDKTGTTLRVRPLIVVDERGVVAALAVQKNEAFQKEAQAMGSKLGPSLVEESFAKGQAQGQLETARSFLRDLVQNRFQVMPEDLDRRIAACADVERLRAAARQVLHVQQPQDISL